MNRRNMEKKVEEKKQELIINYSGVLNFLMKIIDDELKVLVDNELKVLNELKFGKKRYVAEIINKPTSNNSEDPRIKSVKSILDKIKRGKGEYTLRNFPTKMPDIFRFRIVCNYLSDVVKVVKKLRNSHKISEQFRILKGKDEDKIYESRMKEPEKAQWLRLHSFVFKYRKEENCPKIEVQIMTMLFDAWDRKDHYLFYEVYRTADKKELTKPKIKMNAMSELLYVADEFFDKIQEEVSKERGIKNE